MRRRALCACLSLPLVAAGCRRGDGDGGDDGADADGGDCIELLDGECVVETWADPPVLAPDAQGVHHLRLDATEVEIAGQRHCVRAYNGSFTAPTIISDARDAGAARSVRVDLGNHLDGHDFRTLDGGVCACTTSTGDACDPAHLHDHCAPPSDDCTCVDARGEPCAHMFDFNATNLHAHGSHVWPDYARGGPACESTIRDGVTYACRECGPDTCDGDDTDDVCFHADDVLNTVHPQSGARYRWDIDEDGTHHSGLQWYHPHIHGTTALQVASGAAGAWIVRGPVDDLPGIAEARERVMIFSTPPIADDNGFAPLADGTECTSDTLTFNGFDVLGDTQAKQLNVINGVHRPRMITSPAQVERWRILHAGFLDEVFLGVFRGTDANCTDWSTADEDTLVLTQIARDGLLLPEPFEHPFVFLSPGYRIEAILGGEGELADGETWCLIAARFLQPGDTDEFGEFGESPTSPIEPPTLTEVLARFDEGDVVSIVNVTANAGTATETTRPDFAAIAALSPSLDLDGTPSEARCADAAAVTAVTDIDQAAVLQVGFFTSDDPDPCDCANYNVNCVNFEDTDRARYPFDRDLMLGSVEHWRVGASFDGHPFHIHINPVVVCPNDNVYDPLPFPHWRDTYLVNMGRKIDMLSHNRAFSGPFVFHCHKLTHEDHGMMELIRVCDPAVDDTCGDYGWRSCDADDLDCAQALAATDCALAATGPLEAEACTTALGAPGNICAPNACLGDADCMESEACDGTACVPAPCMPVCTPPATCVHGVCE